MQHAPLLMLAFGYGLLHAFDPDHLAAVSTFVVRHRKPSQAVGFGVRWGIGHSFALLVFGSLLILFRLQVAEAPSRWMEIAVGVVLLALGSWALWDVRRQKVHFHRHDHHGVEHRHLHSHAATAAHDHPHIITAIGVLHGTAGTAAVLVLIPVSIMTSAWLIAGYIAAFSAGVILSMATYCYLVGKLLGHAIGRLQSVHTWARALTGCLSCSVGVWWIVRNLM